MNELFVKCPRCSKTFNAKTFNAETSGTDNAVHCPHCKEPCPIPASWLTFTCAQCGAELSAAEDVRGESADCDKCGSRILIPRQSGAMFTNPQAATLGPMTLQRCPRCYAAMRDVVCADCGMVLTPSRRAHSFSEWTGILSMRILILGLVAAVILLIGALAIVLFQLFRVGAGLH